MNFKNVEINKFVVIFLFEKVNQLNYSKRLKKVALGISKISNRTSLQTIQQSVNELANPYSNSISEKCSRIRESFMKSIDKRLAEPYCVNGDRNGLKCIPLDRSLVEFEECLY